MSSPCAYLIKKTALNNNKNEYEWPATATKCVCLHICEHNITERINDV